MAEITLEIHDSVLGAKNDCKAKMQGVISEDQLKAFLKEFKEQSEGD